MKKLLITLLFIILFAEIGFAEKPQIIDLNDGNKLILTQYGPKSMFLATETGAYIMVPLGWREIKEIEARYGLSLNPMPLARRISPSSSSSSLLLHTEPHLDSFIELKDGMVISSSQYGNYVKIVKNKYNLTKGVTVIADNGPIVIDGNGSELSYLGMGPKYGDYCIFVASGDVTVKNTNIVGWYFGIYTDPYDAGYAPGTVFNNIIIRDNIFDNNQCAIQCHETANSNFSYNYIKNSKDIQGVQGIKILKVYYDSTDIGNNIIEGNEIHVGSFSEGIGIGSDGKGTYKFNTIRNNTITYTGCEESSMWCCGSGISILGGEETEIIKNNIRHFSGNSIAFCGEKNKIYGNKITDLWCKIAVGIGVLDFNIWNISQQPPNHIIKNNYIVGGSTLILLGTQGYTDLDLFFGVTWGGSTIETNIFKDLKVGYQGFKPDVQLGPNCIKANDFINNSVNINDKQNTIQPLQALNNYFSDFSMRECDPRQGYCQNPYIWDFSEDPKPKATPNIFDQEIESSVP